MSDSFIRSTSERSLRSVGPGTALSSSEPVGASFTDSLKQVLEPGSPGGTQAQAPAAQRSTRELPAIDARDGRKEGAEAPQDAAGPKPQGQRENLRDSAAKGDDEAESEKSSELRDKTEGLAERQAAARKGAREDKDGRDAMGRAQDQLANMYQVLLQAGPALRAKAPAGLSLQGAGEGLKGEGALAKGEKTLDKKALLQTAVSANPGRTPREMAEASQEQRTDSQEKHGQGDGTKTSAEGQMDNDEAAAKALETLQPASNLEQLLARPSMAMPLTPTMAANASAFIAQSQQAAASAATMSTADIARQVQMQLTANSRGGSANLQLQLGADGALQLDIKVQDGVASMVLRAASPELGRQLTQEIQQLTRALEAAGLQTGSVEVQTSTGQDQGRSGQQQGPESGFLGADDVDPVSGKPRTNPGATGNTAGAPADDQSTYGTLHIVT